MDSPSWLTALDNLRQVIATDNLLYQVRLIEIFTPEQTQEERFLGPPKDLDLWSEMRTRYNLCCRIYQTDQGMRGSPTTEMLREKTREILAN